jgi:hypothetical protein
MKQTLPKEVRELVNECATRYEQGSQHWGSPFVKLKRDYPELRLSGMQRIAICEIYDRLHKNYRLPNNFLRVYRRMNAEKPKLKVS